MESIVRDHEKRVENIVKKNEVLRKKISSVRAHFTAQEKKINHLRDVIGDMKMIILELESKRDAKLTDPKMLEKIKGQSNLSEAVLHSVENSLAPITLRVLNRMTREDIVAITLIREASYYEKLRGFQELMKHNDRVVFRNQLEEIEKLRDLLFDDSELYRDIKTLKKTIHTRNNHISKLKKLLAAERILSGRYAKRKSSYSEE